MHRLSFLEVFAPITRVSKDRTPPSAIIPTGMRWDRDHAMKQSIWKCFILLWGDGNDGTPKNSGYSDRVDPNRAKSGAHEYREHSHHLVPPLLEERNPSRRPPWYL